MIEKKELFPREFFFSPYLSPLLFLSIIEEVGMLTEREKRVRLIGTPLSVITLVLSSLAIRSVKFAGKLPVHIYIEAKLAKGERERQAARPVRIAIHLHMPVVVL